MYISPIVYIIRLIFSNSNFFYNHISSFFNNLLVSSISIYHHFFQFNSIMSMLQLQLQSPFTYTRKTKNTSTSKKRSYTSTDSDNLHHYDLPTPSTPSINHKRQKGDTLSLVLPREDNVLMDKLATMESKVNNLQDCELKFELQDLIEDSLQILKDIKLPRKSFDEFYTPMAGSTSDNSITSITNNIYETPKDRIINHDKFTSPPRIPKLGYYFQTKLDEIESTGLDL